ncbi:MAG: phage tail tape measure protein [Methanolobus sp.]|uniref:phage tail tape measure protein n=1 Tax=Methanolobus sp. TaxID=1874737 RepID=UPI0027300A8E|nr:phage tail tape measure protein [Methanolobus sp.]MDP2216737.1 phage tail tape measure protein [Methanolobus sp.]
MSSVGELVVSIIGDVGQLKKAFAEVGNEVGQLGSKMQSSGKQMASAGKTMSLAVTAPLVGIAALSYNTAVNFDDSMRKVMAVSGATGDEFEQLRALARELGATTAFSASEAAEGMQYLAMAGFDVNEILAATDDMLNLASAGAIDLGTAADIASNVLTGFGLQASEAGRVADVLAKAAASSNTDIQQLGEAMSYAAPLAAAMGMSMEEAAALIGKMSDAGIQGSRAGTALRGAMTRLASPTAGVAKVLEQYNLTLADVDPSTRSFTDILETLSNAGLSTADAMELFGQEAGPGMLALMSTGTNAIREQTLELENAGGAAQEMADIMQGGPGGAARQLKSAMEELMIAIGDVVTVGVLPLVRGLTKLAQMMSKIPTHVLKIIVVLGAIAAAVGPILLVVGTLMSGVGGLLTFIGGAGGLTAIAGGLWATLSGVVGVILGPVGIALAALALAAYVIYKNWDKIGPALNDTFDNIKAAVEPVISAIGQFVSRALAKISEWWEAHGEIVTAGVMVLITVLGRLVSFIADVVAGTVQKVLPPILTLVEHILEQILNVILIFSYFLTGNWEGAWSTLKTIVQTQMDFVMSIVSNALGSVFDIFASIGSDLYESGKSFIQNFIDGIKSKADSLKSTVSDVLGGVGRFFPHSPAKEGPLKVLPNWDAYFIDPLQQSVGRINSIVPEGLKSVAGAVQNVTNSNTTGSTTNNTYAGDEFVIQNVNLSSDYPFERFVRDLEQYNRQKHVRRGY